MKKEIKTYCDNELLSLAESGEYEAAFRELYSRYTSKIYLYCRKVIGERQTAEDIFQEVFLKFYSILKSGLHIENVLGYLLRIARNQCINYKRKTRVPFSSIEDIDPGQLPRSFESDELTELVNSSLEMLPAEHKEAFILQVYEGLSYKEIATITDVPLTTVRNRVVRAKQKLREILKTYNEYSR